MSAGFHAMPSRLDGELQERRDLKQRALQYHVGFLDDCLRAILPHDLVLIGAPSGVGKTDLALNIATSNAWAKKRVHYFALEAEDRELERRVKFSLLTRKLHQMQHPQASSMIYADWMLGDCEHICGGLNREVDNSVRSSMATLHTFYRGAKFDAGDLAKAILEIYEETDLIIVDHLHYVDNEDRDEHRGLGDTIKTIRGVSLDIGKPIILIAHLRKRNPSAKQLITTLDDFHGSSNVVKICTHAIALDQAYDIEPSQWYLAPTYISVLKDRRAGAPRLVAVEDFDRRTRAYQDNYTLGRVDGSRWTEIETSAMPSWAKRCKPRNPDQPRSAR